ncbi:MAG: hypothetical protein KJ574_03955, partial [Nanoarchaeota archaeon]|nr:hypothetical protein [Nanoarchaeota archaeon]
MTGINELDRYQRQALIEGWDQTKLSGATVTILGSDKLAQYIAIPLTALGVNVRMVDNASAHEDMMLDITLK